MPGERRRSCLGAAPTNGKALIRVADPRTAFVAIADHLHGRPDAAAARASIRWRSSIPTATLGPDAKRRTRSPSSGPGA